MADTAVRGAAILTRDGLPVISKLGSPSAGETLSAMGATAFAASETAMDEVGGGIVTAVHVRSDSTSLLLYGLSDQLLLALCVEPNLDGETLARIEAAVSAVMRANGG